MRYVISGVALVCLVVALYMRHPLLAVTTATIGILFLPSERRKNGR